MKSNKILSKGFTLIELLVVVAIIGILSAVVLASLNNAKKQGDDAGVKTNLHTVANQAELFFSDNNNSFLPPGIGRELASVAVPCPTYNASGSLMLTKDKSIADAIAEAVKVGDGSSCFNSAGLWAVAVGLKSTANTSWCVDSTGASKQVNFAPSGAINSSTFTCN